MGASFSAQAGELDGAQPEDVLFGVNAVIDGGLGDERGTGLLDRRNRNGSQGAGANGVVDQGDVSATTSSSGTAVGVSISSSNLSVAISNTTINQTATQNANFGTGGAGGTP